jgi:putative ATP-binding cassette transporter
VKNIRSTLATVWRIAIPYFNSEDKWAGRGLLAAVITIELALVGNAVLINLWRARFYNALQDKNWDNFVRDPGRTPGLSALFEPVAPDPLA